METLQRRQINIDRLKSELLHKELGCNPNMIRYTGWNPFDTVEHAKEKTEEDIRRFENGKFYSWIITFQGLPVGTIGAYGYDEKDESIEIGYSIFEGEWGKGYASEAAAEVVRFLIQDKKLHRVHAWSHIDNIASQKVLEGAGLRREGIIKNAIDLPDGQKADQIIYGC